jgi:hypothetical protein
MINIYHNKKSRQTNEGRRLEIGETDRVRWRVSVVKLKRVGMESVP